MGISCIVCARKVSKISPEWNSMGLEELTDYTYEGEVKRCSDKLMRIYQKQFCKIANASVQGNQSSNSKQTNGKNRHNKENQGRERSASRKNQTGQKVNISN